MTGNILRHPIYGSLNSDGMKIQTQETFWGSTPEPSKFPLSQFQSNNQRIQINNFIAALEGTMSVQQNMLPGHWRYPGQSLNALLVTLSFQSFQLSGQAR